MKSQQQGYKKTINFSRYEILKECGLPIIPSYTDRLKESLSKWLGVRIEFEGTFYDGKDYISIGFGIVDSYKIEKKSGKIEVNLNKDWLLKIKESYFFKMIDFNYYKTLKRPLSRRLFEILCKTFQGRDSWETELIKLAKKLTLSPRKVETKSEQKEVYYPSDIMVALKPAINEINNSLFVF